MCSHRYNPKPKINNIKRYCTCITHWDNLDKKMIDVYQFHFNPCIAYLRLNVKQLQFELYDVIYPGIIKYYRMAIGLVIFCIV